ncbi:hypothetical protein RDI58_028657 [Solanum bulbocastanum]|uniref:Uncharacterized protein n=1 Tax=Solanum bulbocastanum TaxID=147425 RepID=A0AAN8SSC4_SOLBU
MYRETKLDSHVDTWIELTVKLNVRVLEIYASFLRPYSLPDVIYDAKKLTTLRLRMCKFEFDISTTAIRFDCLEDLICVVSVYQMLNCKELSIDPRSSEIYP